MLTRPPAAVPLSDPVRIVPLLNLKGGTGKTSTTLGLAREIAHWLEIIRSPRNRVLIVDLDPQANLTSVLAPGLDREALTINDVLHADQVGGAMQAIIDTSEEWGAVDLIPSEIGLAQRETEGGGPTAPLRLRRALRGIEDFAREYAYVLVDCNPSIGLLTVNALAAATAAVIVTEAGQYSARGIQMTLENIEKAAELNAGLHNAGIIINKYDKRVGEQTYRVQEILETYGEQVWNPIIPLRAVVETAAGFGQPVRAQAGPAATEVTDYYAQHAAHLMEVVR